MRRSYPVPTDEQKARFIFAQEQEMQRLEHPLLLVLCGMCVMETVFNTVIGDGESWFGRQLREQRGISFDERRIYTPSADDSEALIYAHQHLGDLVRALHRQYHAAHVKSRTLAGLPL